MGVESISMPMHLDRKQKAVVKTIGKNTFSSSQLHKGHPDYRTNRDVPLRFMNSPPLPLSFKGLPLAPGPESGV